MDATMRPITFSTKSGAIGLTPLVTTVQFPSSIEELNDSPLFANEDAVLEAIQRSYVIALQSHLRKDPAFDADAFVFGTSYRTTKVTTLSRSELNLTPEQEATLASTNGVVIVD